MRWWVMSDELQNKDYLFKKKKKRLGKDDRELLSFPAKKPKQMLKYASNMTQPPKRKTKHLINASSKIL